MLEYRELRIRISRDPAGVYHTYAEGPSGNASGHFTPPYAKGELNGFLGEISDQVGRARKRRAESPDTAQVRHFGGMLFDSLFENEIRDLYNGSLRAAEDQGKGLRLTLSLKDVPELMLVPWEFLYDEPNFLAISDLTPVVRYLDLSGCANRSRFSPRCGFSEWSAARQASLSSTSSGSENIDRALAAAPRRGSRGHLAGEGDARRVAALPCAEAVSRLPLHRTRRVRRAIWRTASAARGRGGRPSPVTGETSVRRSRTTPRCAWPC